MNVPEGLTRFVPMLSYEEVGPAMDWLIRAFGFREQTRLTDAAGNVGHGELTLGDGVIMLGRPSIHYQSPRHHREECDSARRWSEVPFVIDGVLVHVEDLDAHLAQARSAGATILSEIEDESYGRLYRAEDHEGHRWMFVEPAG
jgi:uncharacterized glyoxalase superfamily protein PhnB